MKSHNRNPDDGGEIALLRLIRAIYGSRDTFPQSKGYYRSVLQDKHTDLVAPQLYFLLTSREKETQVPAFFLHALRQQALRQVMRSGLIKQELGRLLQRCEQTGIDVIPLKGPLFAEKYFGSLLARGTSDIDILVRPAQLEQAMTVARELGFNKVVRYEPEHFHRVLQKERPHDHFPLNIEIHWHFLRKNTSNLDMRFIWRDSIRCGNYRHIRELSDFHAFYLTVLHGWNHELLSWKYFIDIMQLIDVLKDRLDYEKLLRFARQTATYRRVARTLSIVYYEFPELNRMCLLPWVAQTTYWWREADLADDHRLKATLRVLLKRIGQVGDYDTPRQRGVFLRRNLLPDPAIMARIIGPDKLNWPRALQYVLFLGKCSEEIMRSVPGFLKMRVRRKAK